MKFYEMERVKKILGLPPEAGNREIEARLADLVGKEEKWRDLPPEEMPEIPAKDKGTLVYELAKMEYEPLLPVEKKLIVYSVALGLVLLVVFVWVSFTYFPGTH